MVMKKGGSRSARMIQMPNATKAMASHVAGYATTAFHQLFISTHPDHAAK
jgi:hypothetical protein